MANMNFGLGEPVREKNIRLLAQSDNHVENGMRFPKHGCQIGRLIAY